MVSERLQPQPLCQFVNQLDTAGRFMWNEVNATKFVCNWDATFAAYLAKKRSEGKHYNVAISHAAKKLVRVIYQLQRTGQAYVPAA